MIDKEPDPSWFTLSWLTYLFVIFFSCCGGLVNLIQRYRLAKDRRFSLKDWLGDLFISAFAGMLVYYLCKSIPVNDNLMAGLIGIAGHMGGRLIFMLEFWGKEIIRKKFGLEDPTREHRRSDDE